MRRRRVVALQALCFGLIIWLTLHLAYTTFSNDEKPVDHHINSRSAASEQLVIGEKPPSSADDNHQGHGGHHPDFHKDGSSLVRGANKFTTGEDEKRRRLEAISEAIEAGLLYQGPSMDLTIEEMERAETDKKDAKLAKYVRSILDPRDQGIKRMSCPEQLDTSRYGYLRKTAATKTKQDQQQRQRLKYFFALNLRDSVQVLPRLLSTVLETIRFLGPEQCALSIVEGHSADETYEILDSLTPSLEGMGLAYFLRKSDIDPLEGEGNRIAGLAELRNLALEPLFLLAATSSSSKESSPSSSSSLVIPSVDLSSSSAIIPTILFLNDVVSCPEDLLELLHQRFYQSADMTCAMDWKRLCPSCDPVFYDVWVARTLSGNLFFDIPRDGSYDEAWDLFFADEEAQVRYYRKEPFQVSACWNGAVAFTAEPLLLPLPLPLGGGGGGDDKGRIGGGRGVSEEEEEKEEEGKNEKNGKKKKKTPPVRFRASREGECYMGEPTLFCKDMWRAGYGRIAVVPTVSLDYSDKGGAELKASMAYTSEWTRYERKPERKRIRWVEEPPEKVVCMVALGDQNWVPWDEGLVE